MKSKALTKITPGEILREDFLKPLALSQIGWPKISVCPPDESMRS